MQPWKNSLIGKGFYAAGRSLKRAPPSVWNGLTIAVTGVIAGYLHQIGGTESMSEATSILAPFHAFHAAGGATAAYFGGKAKNLVDLAIPSAILLADDIASKVAGTTTWEHFGTEAKYEIAGAGLAYLIGWGVSKLTNRRPTLPGRTP